MTLLKTKPRWAPTAIATDRGWSDPVTGEVYVAIGNLKTLLQQEAPEVVVESIVKPVTAIVVEAATPVAEPVEVKTQSEVRAPKEPTASKTKRQYKKKDDMKQVTEQAAEAKTLVNEVVETKLETGQKIIGEVVENTEGVSNLIAE